MLRIVFLALVVLMTAWITFEGMFKLRCDVLTLQSFKKQPDSLEFVYMKDAEPGSVDWNPYNIDIVPHAQVKVR